MLIIKFGGENQLYPWLGGGGPVVQVAAAAISAIYCWSAHNNQAARLAQASNKICSVCGQILQTSHKVQQIAINDMMLA